MATPAKHYTVKRLAEDRWGCSLSHVYDLIDKHELKALKIGKAIRIPVERVEQYEAEHQAWEEGAASESNTGLGSTENTSTFAGQSAGSLNGSQRARLSLLTQNHSRQTT